MLNSHFPHLSLSEFLDQCKTFRIITDKNRRSRLKVEFVENKTSFDKIVEDLDLSIQVIYCSVSSLQDVLLFKVRMSSVSTKHSFKIPRSSQAKDVSSDQRHQEEEREEGEEDSSSNSLNCQSFDWYSSETII